MGQKKNPNKEMQSIHYTPSSSGLDLRKNPKKPEWSDGQHSEVSLPPVLAWLNNTDDFFYGLEKLQSSLTKTDQQLKVYN